MFSPGSKLQVVASNSKKTHAPRKGSMAFFSNYSTGKFNRKIGYWIGSMQVIFVRYGFEDKERCEAKNIIAAIPIIETPETKDFKINKTIDNEINTFGKPAILRIAQETFAKPSSYYGIYAPYGGYANLLSVSRNEWVSWAKSILDATSFQHTLLKLSDYKQVDLMNRYKFKNNFIIDFSARLGDNNEVMKKLRTLVDAKREDTTNTIKMILAMTQRYELTTVLYNIRAKLNGGCVNIGQRSADMLINYMTPIMYTPIFEELVTIIKQGGDPGSIKIVKNLERIKRRVCSHTQHPNN